MATILGKLEDKKFLVSMHEDEIAKLIGYHYESSMPKHAKDTGHYGSHDKIRIGDEIKVAKMFNHLSALEHAGSDMRKTATALRVAADLIDTLPNPLTAVKVEADTETPVA